MIDGMLLLWYILTAGSLVFLVWDLQTNTPATWVMKLAWILVVLYTGPIGLFIFLLSCRQPLPGTHDQYIAAHWKQSVGSLMHCVAGDATGIIIAATLTYRLTLPNGIDLIVEYASGFLVGLFVFQSLFMTVMNHGRYLAAVRRSFFPETVSMNMVMTGMLPVKFIAIEHIAGGDNPLRPEFWGIMSLATLAGMLVAYPINSWMVRRGIKHGMMSAMPSPAATGATPMTAGMKMDDGMNMPEGMTMPAGEHMAGGMTEPTKVPPGRATAIIAGTLAIFVAAIWVTSLVVPIHFT
ncbi:MAG: DUF4396 domain-containing protein [Dehalococcoidia bacterium]